MTDKKNLSLLEVKVWGDFACFTRPDMKVERVSYSVMTPSAARGILEAIMWKPEIRWEVREIHILKEIRHFSILRNEINNKAVVSTAKAWANGKDEHYFAEEDRAQRHTLALRDVAYLIKAELLLKPHATDDIAKYREMFRRRVSKGQSFHQPCLGCREFPAWFGPVAETDQALGFSTDLGRMLFDLKYESGKSGRGQPRFFQGRIENGVLRIPAELYREVNA
ncbi:MAG: type I-C CRISPR-associated protein Cas5 [Candidatus Melainabacteria bacterium HGW-Melainabacteria-1]|nr:MAG: type I-C CRISPR-associated protein Cas5 [Candidatus Melainabacteria bacterium HGW-Melainabacteria-1]